MNWSFVIVMLIGAIAGGVYAGVAARGPWNVRAVIAGTLILAAVAYPAFRLGNLPGPTYGYYAMIELAVAVVFVLAAAAGVRRRLSWLAMAWGCHAAVDAAVAILPDGVSPAPWWYPPLCAGWDLAVMLVLLPRLPARPDLHIDS